MTEIQWTLYPYVAELEHGKAWLAIQKKLLRAPKTIDAYARGLNDFLSVCKRFAVRVESATKGDIASYVEEMASRPRPQVQGSYHRHGTVGLANKTMLQRLTAVRLFYDFLMEIGVRATNPVGRGATPLARDSMDSANVVSFADSKNNRGFLETGSGKPYSER